MKFWTHTTVENLSHSTITTYHLTPEAREALTIRPAQLPTPVRVVRVGNRLRRFIALASIRARLQRMFE